MQFLIVLAALTVVVIVVSGPLRREYIPRAGSVPAAPSLDEALERERSELEAARDAKYREIRDAELDHRTGKLSDADYAAVDGALRGEAIEILRQLDAVHERSAATIGEQ